MGIKCIVVVVNVCKKDGLFVWKLKLGMIVEYWKGSVGFRKENGGKRGKFCSIKIYRVSYSFIVMSVVLKMDNIWKRCIIIDFKVVW